MSRGRQKCWLDGICLRAAVAGRGPDVHDLKSGLEVNHSENKEVLYWRMRLHPPDW
jgi:hypothetical protein